MIDTKQFEQDVYEIVRQIPTGKVISYGEVARLAGCPNHSRLVGRIMSQCPVDSDVPCHRVVNAKGELSCVFRDQRRLLQEEGITFLSNGNVDMNKCDYILEADFNSFD